MTERYAVKKEKIAERRNEGLVEGRSEIAVYDNNERFLVCILTLGWSKHEQKQEDYFIDRHFFFPGIVYLSNVFLQLP